MIQERADKYNKRFDELEEQGEDLVQIPKIIAQEDQKERHAKYV